MPDRRTALTLGAALLVAPALPGAARSAPQAAPQTAPRGNPMPEELRKALEQDANAPVLGNARGDVTLTEFFDYNCPFCRSMVPVMQQLIAADPQLRVVFREWPVFGEGSEFAARAALAALPQGKYWQMHTALMGMKARAEEPTVLRVARTVGLDEARLRRDMEGAAVLDHLARSGELADHMGLQGTPSFIAGDEGAFGAYTLAELQGLVARARATLG